MKEKTLVLILCIILAIIGIGASYLYLYQANFNFYKSELTVNGNEITEKLYYHPDRDYHTLYRTFVDNMYVNSMAGNSITIETVKCSAGESYAYAKDGFFTFDEPENPKAGNPLGYTEVNEYGCSFNNEYGFKKGSEYWIEAKFKLNAVNIFQVNGKKYIKFVVYSPDNHVFLTGGKNFIVNGDAEMNNIYTPKDNAIIYIPYENSEGKTVVPLSKLDYDNSYWMHMLLLLLGLIPALGLYLVWRFFGRENLEPEIPEELSQYPVKRKGWEVASYFDPPFNSVDNKFLSSLMLDLYRRKVIDIKTETGILSKKCYIKIMKKPEDLDKAEAKFLETVEALGSDGKFVSQGYVDIAKAGKSWGMSGKIRKKFKEMQDIIKVAGKDYLDSKGAAIYTGFSVLFAMLCFFLNLGAVLFPAVAGVAVGFIFGTMSSLLVRFKEQYYDEYKKWQAFKNYLNHAPSLKLHGYKGVVLWDEYLIYAAAFGISDKVIKQLQAQGLISQKQAGVYVVAHSASTSFASATGFSSSGGHGGAGGGGVGGGGGGGR